MSNKVHPYYKTAHEVYSYPTYDVVLYGQYDYKARGSKDEFDEIQPTPRDAKAVEEEEEELTRLQKLARRPLVVLVVTFVMVGYAVLSIAFDWLWVDDMVKAQKSLVFGPPDSSIIGTLIFIASIGTLTFIAEIVNLIDKTFYDNEIISENVSQVLSLFLEEVPQVTLNVLLSACREVPMSYFQLVKAALVLLGSGLRILKLVIRWLTAKKTKREGRGGIIPVLVRWIILAACLYIFCGGILIFAFTYTVSENEDSTGIKLPPNLMEEHYDGSRYFYQSGIYFSHPSFQHCDPSRDQLWIKLESLMDFREGEETQMDVIFAYGDDMDFISIASPVESSCFVTAYNVSSNYTQCHIQQMSDSVCGTDNFNTTTTEITIKFQEVESTKTLVFGDIQFQGILQTEDTCVDLTSNDWGELRGEHQTFCGQLQYFKAAVNVNDTNNFLLGDDGELRHFRSGQDLVNVTEAWKTGYRECEMTGSFAPNPSTSLGIEC